jgi:hypothetical protein
MALRSYVQRNGALFQALQIKAAGVRDRVVLAKAVQ